MKNVLFNAPSFLFLCGGIASPAKADGPEEIQAGEPALELQNYSEPISFFTKPLISEKLIWGHLVKVDGFRDLAEEKGGDFEKALVHNAKAIEIDPYCTVAFYSRGKSRENMRNYAMALIEFDSALENDFKDTNAGNDLASLLADCSDGRARESKHAIELAEKALNLMEAAFN